jgi:uncharacterized protein (TIGR02646 family)
MAEFTLEKMAEVRARYEGECHEREIHRQKTLEYLEKQNTLAIAEFERRKSGKPASKKDLWTQLTGYRKNLKSGVTGPLIRKALRAFLVTEQNGLCCYCQRPLLNIAHAKPIEHILPRVDFVQYTFQFWNLAIACFDCNQIKLDKNWANVDKKALDTYPGFAEFTEMYHPRFHPFSKHVRFIRVQTNELLISIYIGNTVQGRHLCLNHLQELSAREIVLNSNPQLRMALEVINTEVAETEGNLPPELKAYLEALNKSTSQLYALGTPPQKSP